MIPFILNDLLALVNITLTKQFFIYFFRELEQTRAANKTRNVTSSSGRMVGHRVSRSMSMSVIM